MYVCTSEYKFLEIDNLVSSIFNAKRLAVDTDITALEQQIDLLIYHLYNLTMKC